MSLVVSTFIGMHSWHWFRKGGGSLDRHIADSLLLPIMVLCSTIETLSPGGGGGVPRQLTGVPEQVKL